MNTPSRLVRITFLTISYFICTSAFAQTDTWSNVSKAADDRYTNPKSAVYAGPNGWWNFGEIRAEGVTDKALKYNYKGGLTTNSGAFLLAESGKLLVFYMNFGTEQPGPGTYQVSKEPNAPQKKVQVSFSDVSGNKLRNWTATEGTITVSAAQGFIYFKSRNLSLQPDGIHNEGINKQPLTLGLEGAAKP